MRAYARAFVRSRALSRGMNVTIGRPITRFNSLQHIFDAFKDVYETQSVERLTKQRILPRADYVVDPPLRHETTQGADRMRLFEELLEKGCNVERGDFQRYFHAEVTKELCENIVGPEDWAKIGEQMKRTRGWTLIRHLLMASAPRRFGKSVALSMTVVCYAVVVPQSVQCIFSTGRRASKNDLEICYKLLCDMGCKDWIVKFNDEELWLLPNPNRPTDVRKIFSYPSKATMSTVCGVCSVACPRWRGVAWRGVAWRGVAWRGV